MTPVLVDGTINELQLSCPPPRDKMVGNSVYHVAVAVGFDTATYLSAGEFTSCEYAAAGDGQPATGLARRGMVSAPRQIVMSITICCGLRGICIPCGLKPIQPVVGCCRSHSLQNSGDILLVDSPG